MHFPIKWEPAEIKKKFFSHSRSVIYFLVIIAKQRKRYLPTARELYERRFALDFDNTNNFPLLHIHLVRAHSLAVH